MVVTIAKQTFCSKKVTVIKLIGRVLYNIYVGKPIQNSPIDNVPATTTPLYFMIHWSSMAWPTFSGVEGCCRFSQVPQFFTCFLNFFRYFLRWFSSGFFLCCLMCSQALLILSWVFSHVVRLLLLFYLLVFLRLNYSCMN